MDDCIFCKIIKGEIPVHYKLDEDKQFLVFLDINPINQGHAIITTKKHYKNIFEIPENILINTGPIIKKIAIAIKEGVGAEGINVGMNNGSAAGQLVPHAHFHIIPRFPNDGHYHWKGTPYKTGEAQKTAEKIKKFL